MRFAWVLGLTFLCGCSSGADGRPAYQPREGPRLSSTERRGILEYEHSLYANLCYPRDEKAGGDPSGRVARDAARELRAFERLLRVKPDYLIKTSIASSDEGDFGVDVTLREYARTTSKALEGNAVDLPRSARACQQRYARRLDRLAR